MNGVGLAIVIAIGLIILIILYKLLKPYFLKYDTTLVMTGGLGSGKTLTAVKTSVILIRKQRFYKWACHNFFKYHIGNFFKRLFNKSIQRRNNRRMKKGKKPLNLYILWEKRKKPLIYSNIPIHFKTHLFGRKREWANMLDEQHILLLKEIREYSVVFIDEMPQFVNQFNWNSDLVQKNVNEFITFFRHYIGGYFLTTSQSIDDVVCQIRRKLNQAVWCFDFHKWCFGLFYTIRMCDIMLGDQIGTMSTTQIEENTKLHFGFFPAKNTYDTRCYSERYKNILLPHKIKRWNKVKTNKVLRLQEYISPLDDTTTREEKEEMNRKAEKLCKQLKS